jgi:hypothetical protein
VVKLTSKTVISYRLFVWPPKSRLESSMTDAQYVKFAEKVALSNLVLICEGRLVGCSMVCKDDEGIYRSYEVE